MIEFAFFTGLAAVGLYVSAIILPLQSQGPLKDFALKNNGDLREEIGWEELVKTVADIRDSVPPDEQRNLGVVVGNYGEGGAIEILGPKYNLPMPISGTNSAWFRGYPTPPPSTLIVLGFSEKGANRTFNSCHLASHITNSAGVHNEEIDDHPDIFVCGPPRKPWPEFWKDFRRYG
jgi:hypothetical protein